MPKIIKFPNGEKNEGDEDQKLRVKREFCRTCGTGLDLWSDDNGTAYGLCVICDFQVGTKPIILCSEDEE
tara:strand:- start:284 stop:493 length:210 start_codon:yes stop_codon:yes gene_type:complete